MFVRLHGLVGTTPRLIVLVPTKSDVRRICFESLYRRFLFDAALGQSGGEDGKPQSPETRGVLWRPSINSTQRLLNLGFRQTNYIGSGSFPRQRSSGQPRVWWIRRRGVIIALHPGQTYPVSFTRNIESLAPLTKWFCSRYVTSRCTVSQANLDGSIQV